MPDNEARQIDPEGDIREIARHVAVAAGKIGTTVELREEVGTLAGLVKKLVDEVHPLTEALPTLARKEEIKDTKAQRRRVFLAIGGVFLILALTIAVGFTTNRVALNNAHSDTCRAINGSNGVLRDLIKNSTASADQPIDPNLDPTLQNLIRDSRERSIKFRDKALADLADSDC